MRNSKIAWEMPETPCNDAKDARRSGLQTLQPLYPYLRYPLGKRLAQIGFTLSEAARIIGVKKYALSRYISKKHPIPNTDKKMISAWLIAKGIKKKRSRKPKLCPQCNYQLSPKVQGGV